MTVRWITIAAALTLMASSLPADAQGRNRRRPPRARGQGAFSNKPRLLSGTGQSRRPLGTFDTNRYAGIVTRPDQIRSILPQRGFTYNQFEPPELSPSPIKQFLDRRNLLSTRSPLARRATSHIGRNDFVSDESGQMLGDYSRIEKEFSQTKIDMLKADDGTYQDAIASRIKTKADEYFDAATQYFRKGRLLDAKDYFSILREAEPEKTRGLLGLVLVAVQRNDFIQANGALSKAFGMANTLDDLKVDTAKFFKTPEDFRRRLELLNLFAQSNPNNPAPHLLLAYYSWLNGDIGTAIDAAQTAEKNSADVGDDAPKKFKELLIELRSTPRRPSTSPA